MCCSNTLDFHRYVEADPCSLKHHTHQSTPRHTQKQKLNGWVDAALDMEGGMEPGSGSLPVSVQTVLLYIDNASKDVRVSTCAVPYLVLLYCCTLHTQKLFLSLPCTSTPPSSFPMPSFFHLPFSPYLSTLVSLTHSH